MKILEFDSVGGASGDMILAALIDLGADPDALRAGLAGLRLEPFAIEARRDVFGGLRGTQVRVVVDGGPEPGQPADHDHPHPHDHDHGHVHKHDHAHDHAHPHPEQHAGAHHAKAHAPHRGLAEITAIITKAGLPAAVRDMSLNVFGRLAEAEARVHGVTPDKIHFHEVGAVDSIVDIVGCCLARDMLGIAAVAVGVLPLGHGTIKCDHGVMPSPAPATVELLRDFPSVRVDEPFELVTPTGAALLTAWRSPPSAPPGRILAAGHGFGHARLHGRPNLLRAILRAADAVDAAADDCLVMECNLDDMTPELVGALTGRLRELGVLDVFIAPVQMKKQRPGFLLTVLCRPDQRAAALDMLFMESTTFGVREHMTRRTVLERRHETVHTPYGAVRVKVGTRAGHDLKCVPEYEDCLALARQKNVPLSAVYAAAAIYPG